MIIDRLLRKQLAKLNARIEPAPSRLFYMTAYAALAWIAFAIIATIYGNAVVRYLVGIPLWVMAALSLFCMLQSTMTDILKLPRRPEAASEG